MPLIFPPRRFEAAEEEAVCGRDNDDDVRPPVRVPVALMPAVVRGDDDDNDDDDDGDDDASRISAASEACETP